MPAESKSKLRTRLIGTRREVLIFETKVLVTKLIVYKEKIIT